jgi:hypothetical protein
LPSFTFSAVFIDSGCAFKLALPSPCAPHGLDVRQALLFPATPAAALQPRMPRLVAARRLHGNGCTRRNRAAVSRISSLGSTSCQPAESCRSRRSASAIARMLRARIVRGRFHRADLYHRLLVAEFAAYGAATQKSDLVRFHCRFPDMLWFTGPCGPTSTGAAGICHDASFALVY